MSTVRSTESDATAEFAHWDYRLVGNTRANSATAALLRRLQECRVLGSPRARLHRNPQNHPLRTALLIDLPATLHGLGALSNYRAFWLVEQANRRVFFYGLERPYTGGAVGGRVIPDVPALDPAARWVDQVARHAAQSVLSQCRSACLRIPADATELGLLAQVEATLLRAALHAFRAGLDAEALAVLSNEGTGVMAVYNHYWLRNGTPDRNRRQAAQSYPWFQDLLRQDWRLRRTVDNGRPLSPALAEHWQVPQATLRRCRTLLPAELPHHVRAPVLKCAGAYPVDYLPRSTEDWIVFRAIAHRLHDLAELLQAEVRALATPFRGGWKKGLDDLRGRTGAPLDIDGVFDLMHATYYYGIWPAVADRQEDEDEYPVPVPQPPAAFFPLWFGRYELPRLHAMAVRWRLAFGALATERQLGDGASSEVRLAWPAVVEHGATHGPYRVVELTSLEGLEAEGQRLQHCVASYAVKCLLSASCIFSLRDKAGNSLSTFEVDFGGDKPALTRHHAFANAPPSREQQEVAMGFVARVLGEVPPERMALVRRARRLLGEPLRSRLAEANQMPPSLTLEEEVALAQAVAFAHPAEARRDGVLRYLQTRGAAVLEAILDSHSSFEVPA